MRAFAFSHRFTPILCLFQAQNSYSNMLTFLFIYREARRVLSGIIEKRFKMCRLFLKSTTMRVNTFFWLVHSIGWTRCWKYSRSFIFKHTHNLSRSTLVEQLFIKCRYYPVSNVSVHCMFHVKIILFLPIFASTQILFCTSIISPGISHLRTSNSLNLLRE